MVFIQQAFVSIALCLGITDSQRLRTADLIPWLSLLSYSTTLRLVPQFPAICLPWQMPSQVNNSFLFPLSSFHFPWSHVGLSFLFVIFFFNCVSQFCHFRSLRIR